MFNWAIIGTGSIANTVACEITKSGNHCIKAVYSRTLSRAETFAKKFGATAYDNLADCVLDESVQGVYIATPHSAHYPLLLKCIELKKPILCEKSFTVNTKQAQNVYETAQANQVYVCEAMWTRFNPVTKQVLQWIKDGKIGQVKCFKGNFSFPSFSNKFMLERMWKKEYAGGALLDLGVYPVSYAQMLFGDPTSITCRAKFKGEVDFEDNIKIEFANGAKAKLNCSFLRLRTYTGKIIGTEGKIIIPIFYRPKQALLIQNGVIKSRFRREKHNGAGYIYQFDKVADEMNQHLASSTIMTPSDSIKVMQMMDDIRQQIGLVYPNEIESV